jgi:hypothetical protein
VAEPVSESDFNRAGPYRIGKRVKDHTGKGFPWEKRLGRVYCSVSQLLGTRAAVAVPHTPMDWRTGQDWQVRIHAGTAATTGDKPFLAVEVLTRPGGTAPAHELSDGLDAAATLLAHVAANPDGTEHVLGRRVFLPWMRRARSAVGILACLVLGGVVTRVSADAAPPHHSAGEQLQPAAPVVASGLGVQLPGNLTAYWVHPSLAPSIGQPMPRDPLPGQRRPDAQGRCPTKQERALFGGCWVPLKEPPPCEESFEHEGTCYKISGNPERGKTSDADTGGATAPRAARD